MASNGEGEIPKGVAGGPASSTPIPERRGFIGGLVLIVIGLILLGERFIPDFTFGDYWPLILIAVGGGLLWKAIRKE